MRFSGYASWMGVQTTLAANLRALMAYYGDRKDSQRDKPEALARTAKGRIGKTTIYDVLGRKKQWLRDSQLDALAQALDVQAWMLLYPQFEPDNRPIVVTEAELEEMVIERIQEVNDELQRLKKGVAKGGRPGTDVPFASGQTPPFSERNPAAKTTKRP